MSIIYFQIADDMNPENLSDLANSKVIYNINGCLVFFSLAIFMSNCSSVVLTFPAERAVFLREYSANMYSVSAYFFGRSSTEVPFVVLSPILISAISYYIIGFNDYNASKIFIFSKKNFYLALIHLVLIMVFLSLAGNAVGLLIGCLLHDPKAAANVIPVITYHYTY